MVYVKWTFYGLLILAAAAFFDYVLPQHDVVRIVDTQVARMDVRGRGSSSGGVGTTGVATRDVRLIYAKAPDGDDMVYRNEDTGWGFPFYFKFSSDNLMAEASDRKSTAESPKWVVIRHYGWRIPMFSMYPNVMSIRPAAGPGENVLPLVQSNLPGAAGDRRAGAAAHFRSSSAAAMSTLWSPRSTASSTSAAWWRRRGRAVRALSPIRRPYA